MTPADLSRYRKSLQADQAELQQSLSDLSESGGAENAALAGTLRDTLQEIEHALAKIPDTYGLCEQCGGPIGTDRLDAMPAARYCFDCANAGP